MMDNVLHKNEIAAIVAVQLGCSEFEAYKALNAVLSSIKDAIREEHKVTLKGFGTFEVRKMAARRIRLIGGEEAGNLVRLPPRKCAKFTPGSELKRVALSDRRL